MINGFKVITLCGSTRFKEQFLEAQKRLTLDGNVVISVGLFGHSGDDEAWSEGAKEMLDCQHLAKIDLADEIFVINVGGYIGDSTRREIAYAEFKGKSISYLEECRKTSLYDNYAALSELHESGKLSDEESARAKHWFDEKRNAAIAEYNACQGPWPYQWKDIDKAVCGILQQHGLVSIDYHDIKDFYDADCVYEVRIKGKGANDEEQLQSIIDTIKSEYITQLRPSKKVVATLCNSSNLSSQLEKFADCMDGLNVVWQTRKESEIEMSIVYITKTVQNMEKETKKQEYDKWVSKVCSFLVEESKKLNVTCGTFQSKPILNKQPDVVILGYNPHEIGKPLPFNKIKERFYEGNPYFYSDERNEWPIWAPLRWSFEWAGYTKPTEDGNFVFFNAVFFGTNDISEFKKLPRSNEVIKKCLQYTGEVIQNIFRPKCVVCLSVPDCFDSLNKQFRFSDVKRISTLQETDADLIEFALNKERYGWITKYDCKRIIKKGSWDGIPVYGIPHPSGRVSYNDFGAIALYLRSEMQKLGI